MPNSMLFAINNEGRVFGLSTIGSNWREFPYLGLDFKSLSAVPHFLWAVGGDRQVYVHVHGLDIPIRVKEETYENQRWFPLDGFSKRLLPTDRHQFSTEDGLTKRNKGDIRVPSMAWQWESDWHIETTLGGQQLDHDGWTYAMDFPGTYYSSKQWSSCVRRRKWVRNRKYVAMNSWCAIAPLHKDPTQEPFIDVSVGGQCMTGGPLGALQVWAVTAHGRVMWRKGVSMTCPEGTRWNAIPIPNGCEVKQISCGATGLVWSVLWSGKALVRIGINAGNTIGDSWEVINAPEAGLKLSHVSVGTNAVWALTSNGRVWFRKGIDGNATANKNQAKGTGWVEMVGTMAMVSVAPSDQVFAVGRDDRTLYMRVGVTSSELTGKRWRCLQAGVQVSRTSSVSSLNHYRQHRSTISLNHSTGSSDRCDWLETSRSAPTSLQLQPVWQKPVQSSSLPASEGSVEEPILENVMSEEVLTHRKVTAWSPVRSVGSLIGLEANPDTDPHADWDRTVFPEREIICEPGWSQADTLWSSVEAGAIQFDPAQLPNWFIEIAPNSGLETAPWRTKILEDLSRSHESLTKGFEKYELAVEMTSCIKSVECRCCLMGNPTQQYEDCLLELEWTGSRTASVEIGTLSVLSLEKAVYKYQVSLSEIVCVVSCSEPGCPRIAVHTIDSTKNNIEPLRIHFSGDIDHDDWMASLSSVCCQMHNLEEAPGPNSIWATTKLGDVYAFDPVRLKEQQLSGEVYSKELDCKGKALPWWQVLSNGFAPGSSIRISAFIPHEADRFNIDFECESNSTVALHLNPRFKQGVVVRNSKENSVWGTEEREGRITLTPGDTYEIIINCQQDSFKIFINGEVFAHFEHRMKPQNISHICIRGDVELLRVVYESMQVIIPLAEMFWRQMGGHMVMVESCAAGVTWGLSADNTPYLYTGGWGGSFLGGLEKSSNGIHPMTDSYCCYVYENQRWNPLNGFSSRGLPTDRPMWSDSTGCQKRSKETTRLLSMHWQWLTDWTIDYLTPGGVDSEGWQYAVDFSTSYHARKNMTDYVRRRRWARKCKLSTSGPWIEIGNSKITDMSLQLSPGLDVVCVWAVAANGDALFRKGVTKNNPMGDNWDHVTCDQALSCISCGCGNQVWAVGRNGSTYWRFGITTSNPMGEIWETVDHPKGGVLKKVSVAKWAVWALDCDGNLFVRRDVSPVFPEGSYWQSVVHNSGDKCEGFQDISAGSDEVWAVTKSGALYRRIGVGSENPAGVSWSVGLSANWNSISVRNNTKTPCDK